MKKTGNYFLFTFIILFFLVAGSCHSPADKEDLDGISILKQGTHLAYLSKNGKPLLAFGPNLEHIFFKDYDYERWADWAADHGINHCRTRVFGSPTHNRPRTDIKYMPFKQMEDGRYNLTAWDETYWDRFHKIVSYYESKGVILHFLIFPQCTGGAWTNEAWVYHPDNNVHQETEFLRSEGTTETFWQTYSKGQTALFDIQMALAMKLIEETVNYNNIYYDLCHETFLFTMTNEAREDYIEFLEEATKRFFEKYTELRPDKMPVLGIDTDFIPPGDIRDWIYNHDRFNIMIQGNNNEEWYTSDFQSISLVKQYKKPFCPQESCDLPNLTHIPDCSHPQNLTYFYPSHRTHMRKYVWRWVMARCQLIDIYQKGMGTVEATYADVPDSDSVKQRMMAIEDREAYEPYGHNEFEKDALVLREFWNSLTDYPNLDFKGDIVRIHFKHVRRVLSSGKEAVIYLASRPGIEGEVFRERTVLVMNMALEEGTYTFDVWKPSAPGGIIDSFEMEVENGTVNLPLPEYIDDIAVHVH